MDCASKMNRLVSVSRKKARFLENGRVEIKAVIDEDCYKRIKELKSLLSHRNPDLSYGRLFGMWADKGLYQSGLNFEVIILSMRHPRGSGGPAWRQTSMIFPFRHPRGSGGPVIQPENHVPAQAGIKHDWYKKGPALQKLVRGQG